MLATAAAVPWSWWWVRDHIDVADVVALVTPPLVVVAGLVVVVAAWRRRRVLAVAAASCAVMLVATVVVPWMPRRSAAPAVALRVASANAFAYGGGSVAKAEAILAGDPGIVGVVEARDDLVALLREALPNALEARAPISPGAQVLVSRWPMRPLPLPSPVPEDFSGLLAEVDTPAGPVAVLVAHLRRPVLDISVGRQSATVEWAAGALRATGRPGMLLGDLNLSDRQQPYRWLTGRYRDAGRSDATGPTFFGDLGRLLLLRLDYVFVDRTWCAARSATVRIPGSDHRAVRATVGPCPPG